MPGLNAIRQVTTSIVENMARNKPSPEWAGFAKELGLAIQRRRNAVGMTQEQVAYSAGITRSHYQLLERGLGAADRAANPSLLTLVAVSQVLKTNLVDILPPTPPDMRVGRQGD